MHTNAMPPEISGPSGGIPEATVARLPVYLRALYGLAERCIGTVASEELAAAAGVKFRGGTGSCVVDDYVTRIGRHHYQEVACLVQGHTSASVIVAAAPASDWARARPLLLRAVAAYLVR